MEETVFRIPLSASHHAFVFQVLLEISAQSSRKSVVDWIHVTTGANVLRQATGNYSATVVRSVIPPDIMQESSVNSKQPSTAQIQIISAITAVDVNLKVLGRCFAGQHYSWVFHVDTILPNLSCQLSVLRKYSCLCPPEWTGPSCEFETQQTTNIEDNPDDGNCDLTCLHGGTCRKGNAAAWVGEDSVGGDNLLPENAFNDDFERCVCPQGYTGRRCEHSYQECGNGEHICLDGAVCVPPKDVNHLWTCKCDKNSGSTCNRHTSAECISPESHHSVYRGLESLILCVNDGVCTTYSQDGRM